MPQERRASEHGGRYDLSRNIRMCINAVHSRLVNAIKHHPARDILWKPD